ncbi:hypothetical protein [Streptomyces sp. NPDC001530]|uniref:hypothetical protein n=1 Tax=Streptomyces sp. NPDC001530 TaxID=3364582 RepID=UPI00368E7B41
MSGDDSDSNVLHLPRVGLRPSFFSPQADPVPQGGGADGALTFPQLASGRIAPVSAPLPAIPEPDTARSPMLGVDPGSGAGRDLAALSLLTLAAISVAALRGSYHLVAWLKARRDHHRAIAEKAAAKNGSGGGNSGSPKRVPSGPEFGGKTTRKSGSGAGGSGGRSGGSGRSKVPATFRSGTGLGKSGGTKAGKGPSAKGAGGRKSATSPTGGTGKRSGGKAPRGPRQQRNRKPGRGDAGRGGGSSPKRSRKGPGSADVRAKRRDKAAKAASLKKGNGGGALKKQGPGRTTLAQALKKDAQRAAARRWKKRQKRARKDNVKPFFWTTPKQKKPGKASTTGPAGNPKPTNSPAATSRRLRWRRRNTTPPIWFAPKTGGGPSSSNPGKTRSRKKPSSKPGFRWTRRARWHRTNTKTGTRPTGGTRTRPGGFTPPPGMRNEYTVTLTRDDPPATSQPAAAIAPPRPALPPATGATGTKGPQPMPAPVSPSAPPPVLLHQPSADSELTIYDLIEADADAASEILARVDEAQQVAVATEVMDERLEVLAMKIQELKIPGLLLGRVNRLMEKSAEVRAAAQALAAALPGSSEAIAVAGANAAARHKPLADVTADMGHAAPAEAEYHQE